MESRSEKTLRRSGTGYEYGSSSSSISTIEDIRKLVESRTDRDQLTLDEFFDSLKRWWCKYYKRPYKDPLLAEYSIEELAYEYFDINHSPDKAKNDEADADKADREWAAEEEAKLAKPSEAQPDIIEKTQADEEWANKHLENPAPEDAVGDISTNFEAL